MAKFMRFGSGPKYETPEGGFCTCSFALIQSDNKVLLGKPREHPRWEEEWIPSWSIYTPERYAREFRVWRFPSSYVRVAEHPDEALRRVLVDQLQVADYEILKGRLLVFYDPSSIFPNKMHLDYCFTYDVKVSQKIMLPDWFSELRFIDPSELSDKDFGSAQEDLARRIGLIK